MKDLIELATAMLDILILLTALMGIIHVISTPYSA
jgi:hypothetical protein